ncbi:hypothetical protein J0K78_03320 [Halobacillus sp. GSS1]|uniref:hypothetical protein n=1 Tax=Halobacillus sp. GSS1 TaxID=2815919 RepID=UPI001A8DFB8D|nr:hypothetical protein [Halobacillus sp. GSS1]MBN9653284.1 hypothetical protein [Halobacillus sp. GSS1]
MRELLNNSSKYLSRISDIIRTDATYISKENFLATHTPFTNLGYVNSGIIDSRLMHMSEESFMDKQVLQAREDHQFIIVQGHNGSGKSHFIRWIKERYENEVSPDEEATLFISRWQSTLRGALEQIIESDIFKGSETADQIKKLIQASEHLSDDNLKRNIIHQFAIAVQDDEENQQVKISSKDKRRLYAFLVDSEIQEFMFREKGPIDRIKLKLSAEASNQKLVDVTPRFLPEDFKVNQEQLEAIKRANPSKKALKLLETLHLYDEKNDLKQQLASYLNQFLDEVVQKCTNLRGSDLKDVFLRLREELKEQGKKLTLFIEDITSFTGIDRALVEVLVTEHQGNDGGNRFCRIFSVVGITNEYYKNSFPDNLKERVTGRVFIDEATFTDKDKIVEMAARYINAIYVDKEEIERWARDGGQEENLPVATPFTQQQWANFELQDGRVLPLYPFNKNVLLKIFHGLENKNNRTPRMFLKDVSYVLHEYFNQAPQKQFPSGITDFSKKFQIPSWKDPLNAPRFIERKSPRHQERLATFLRLWGDQSIETRQENGDKTVGGLPKEAFDAFSLPFLAGEVTEVKSGGDDAKKNKSPGSGGKPPTGNSHMGNEKKTEHPVPPVQKPQAEAKSKEQQEFEKLQKELENWMNGTGQLTSIRLFREVVYRAIIDFIDWEAEEVAVPLVKHHLKTTMFNFEAQSAQPSTKNYLLIPRNRDAYYALLGLAAFTKLGKRSWAFENATDFILPLYNWLQSFQEEVIAFVSRPEEVSHDEWTLRKWGILTRYYLESVGGNIPPHASTKVIYEAIMNPRLPEITEEPHRSKEWSLLQKKLKGANKHFTIYLDFFTQFDSCPQGEITADTKSNYFDAAEILSVINELDEQDWEMGYLPEPEITTESENSARMRYLHMLDLLKRAIPTAYDAEKQTLNQLLTSTEEYIGTPADAQALKQTFTEMRSMLAYLNQKNERYASGEFAGLENGNLDASKLSEILSRNATLDNAKLHEGVLLLAQNPLLQLQPFVATFLNMDKLLDRMHDKYEKKRTKAEEELKQQKTEVVIKNSKQVLADLHKALTALHREEDVRVNR